MKITLLDAKQTNIQLKALMNEAKEYHWAVAWATTTELSKILLKNKHKIQKLVIGESFTHTDPKILRGLLGVKKAKIGFSTKNSTFHPKVYCFVNKNSIKAIVGSSNFTNGGTNTNEEACIFIEGSKSDKILYQLLARVDNWWKNSKSFDENYINSYTLKWEANQKRRKEIEKPPYIYKPSKNATHPDIAFKNWPAYIKLIRSEKLHSLERRIAVLDRARQLFDSKPSFADLSEIERKAIAGFIGSIQISGTKLEGIDWGWFGSMRGSGVFKNLVNANNKYLSSALDHIPLAGEVTEEQYLSFVEEYKRAFKGKTRKGGIATASRLLAMKRPDYFVCLDSANARGLSDSFGFSASSANLNNYWEFVIDPIIQSKWWNVKRPVGKEGKIWDYRAAFLDAVFYEEH